MPHKALFTAAACVLLSDAVSLDRVAGLVRATEPAIERMPADSAWPFGGERLAVAANDGSGSRVLVDVMSGVWPDGMGEPQGDPELFMAWGQGLLGPFTWPGALARARRLPWVDGAAAEGAARHTAFIMLRGTRAGDVASVYDPLAELYLLTRLALALESLPEALCYFNPNGESLATFGPLRQSWQRARSGGPMPLDIWTSRRLFSWVQLPGWHLIDTVGVGQLDDFPFKPWCIDHEACFPGGMYAPAEVALFLLNTAHTVVTRRQRLPDGTTTDGPGGIWHVRYHGESLESPPRNVLRWLPAASPSPPAALVDDAALHDLRAGRRPRQTH